VITALLSRIKASNISKTAASAASESHRAAAGLAGLTHVRRIYEEIIQKRLAALLASKENHRSVRS
jgi:hypothetical protein